MKTFFDIRRINESKEADNALKELTKVHKLELELQQLQISAIELFDKIKKYDVSSKEYKKIRTKIEKMLEERKEILEEFEYEKRNLRDALNYIDTEGELDKFFE